jgi:vancomycin permeability regulator SanA
MMFILLKIFKRILIFTLSLAIIIPGYTAYRIWNTGNTSQPQKADVIVVLGAAEYNGVPSDVLTARLTEAKKIYSQGLAKRIITVGGNQKGDVFTEASAGLSWLHDQGVVSHNLVAVATGVDTLSSTTAYVSQMKKHGESSAILVTDKYHCLRALTMARDQGIKATCAPSETGPASTSTSSYRYLFRETFAYLSYLTVGRVGVHLTDQVKNLSHA